ncbi:DUF58 domain-containing protein [Aquabacterium sp.]|uniref:DUF58 domain-containing protein n=1 Tax=Aquabacterium sp. TaxID=1872578 RepID=UPI002CD39C0A|nr:VWA domain-containing protein [Aquabacterium sp.]HSW06554.1 VWA domain-containing protein [Aquabacterium sp.]
MQEFHYRLRTRTGGQRPGAHPGASLGAGLQFAAHARLLDHPDPRRLDLRASLRDGSQHWLVRVHQQRVAVPVHAVVDVSASMHFGATQRKLDVAADFVEALGHSAFRAGDAVGLLAFDRTARDDLQLPARHARGMAGLMSESLRTCRPSDASDKAAASKAGDGAAWLKHAVQELAGKSALVFLVSDFHWPLQALGEVLDTLARARVVPLVIWDPAEIEAPRVGRLLSARDAESGAGQTLWLRETLRTQWRAAVTQRRAEIKALFGARGMLPFWIEAAFDAEALSRHFLDAVA